MAKRESALKSAFLKELKRQLPHAVALRHEDVRTNGIPDLSITIGGRTSWWEFKHATPDFSSPGLQALVCTRLAAAGYCRYIIFWESEFGTAKRTMIVHPKNILDRVGIHMTPEEVTPGFDHKWLVEQIRSWHRV